jgi:hypothetical protein
MHPSKVVCPEKPPKCQRLRNLKKIEVALENAELTWYTMNNSNEVSHWIPSNSKLATFSNLVFAVGALLAAMMCLAPTLMQAQQGGGPLDVHLELIGDLNRDSSVDFATDYPLSHQGKEVWIQYNDFDHDGDLAPDNANDIIDGSADAASMASLTLFRLWPPLSDGYSVRIGLVDLDDPIGHFTSASQVIRVFSSRVSGDNSKAILGPGLDEYYYLFDTDAEAEEAMVAGFSAESLERGDLYICAEGLGRGAGARLVLDVVNPSGNVVATDSVFLRVVDATVTPLRNLIRVNNDHDGRQSDVDRLIGKSEDTDAGVYTSGPELTIDNEDDLVPVYLNVFGYPDDATVTLQISMPLTQIVVWGAPERGPQLPVLDYSHPTKSFAVRDLPVTLYMEGNVFSFGEKDTHLSIVAPMSQRTADMTVVDITAVEWADFNSDNPIVADGLNYRIFPDRPSWDSAGDYTSVLITATVTPPVPLTSVKFTSFDVDDPSSTAAPVDDEDQNSDNRGTIDQFQDDEDISDISGSKHRTEVYTDATGKAHALFHVTRQPGDNWRVAAGLVDIGGNCFASQGVEDGSLHCLYPREDPVDHELDWEAMPNEYTSPMLTVWRRLHFERDSMSSPSFAQYAEWGQIVALSTNKSLGSPPAGLKGSQIYATINVNLATGLLSGPDASPNLDSIGLLLGQNGRFEGGTFQIGSGAGAVFWNGLQGNGDTTIYPGIAQGGNVPFTIENPLHLYQNSGMIYGMDQNPSYISPSLPPGSPNFTAFKASVHLNNTWYSGAFLEVAGSPFLVHEVKDAIDPTSDYFDCPYHPDQRADSYITCPVCGAWMIYHPPATMASYIIVLGLQSIDFRLWDDDNPNVLPKIVAAENLANRLADAFIEPHFDTTGVADHNQSDIPFLKNIEYPPDDQVASAVQGWDSKSLNSDSFWVGYLLSGFQGPVLLDGDPSWELGNTVHLGVTSAASGGCVIFQESIREVASTTWVAGLSTLEAKICHFEELTTIHEVGHLVGNSGNEDILDIHYRYTPSYLDLMRSAEHPFPAQAP